LYASGAVAERDVEEILLLKVVQSVDERRPRADADAVGMLKVMVFAAAVMVKSVPVVEVARIWVLPVWVWP
jgi:hypothetical protein